MHPVITEITAAIRARSAKSRAIYLQRLEEERSRSIMRGKLLCGNLAHGAAACGKTEKEALLGSESKNFAIVTAYNDMLSAHEPFKLYPALIKRALADAGATAQVGGGVPAMCDGVTQSQPGMELSLFSRDNIAQGTAVALAHNMFDGALYLGVCDKIVPGLLMGALAFGHLPAIFVPAGPMPSGISNAEKASVRQAYAKGEIDKEAMLKVESASYHSPGTCTFYGTANSNQMMMEVMGLHLPGSSFVNTNTPLRDLLTEAAAKQAMRIEQPVGKMLDIENFVNAIVGLLATGGSTNHTIHLIAMARIAGIVINWDDFGALSKVVSLLTRMYPNGSADVNAFHAAGGMPFVIRELLDAGLLHEDIDTVVGRGMRAYTKHPELGPDHTLTYVDAPRKSADSTVLASVDHPFDSEGGLRVLEGNIGRAVIKSSALKPEQWIVEADALVFESQEALKEAYKCGELNRDFIAVVRYQGPRANGMPELHGLTPVLGALQDEGYRVAIVTDGRMSGASGKVPAAIHVTPEALAGGVIGKIRNGDRIVLDVKRGMLEVTTEGVEAREIAKPSLENNRHGMGRQLFVANWALVNGAEEGATIFDLPGEERA